MPHKSQNCWFINVVLHFSFWYRVDCLSEGAVSRWASDSGADLNFNFWCMNTALKTAFCGSRFCDFNNSQENLFLAVTCEASFVSEFSHPLIHVLIQHLDVGICSDMQVGGMWFIRFPSDTMSVLVVSDVSVPVCTCVAPKLRHSGKSARETFSFSGWGCKIFTLG